LNTASKERIQMREQRGEEKERNNKGQRTEKI
jgi:hypothetical protein